MLETPGFNDLIGTFQAAGDDAIELLAYAARCESILTTLSSSLTAVLQNHGSAGDASNVSTLIPAWPVALSETSGRLVQFETNDDPVRTAVFNAVDGWFSGSALAVAQELGL